MKFTLLANRSTDPGQVATNRRQRGRMKKALEQDLDEFESAVGEVMAMPAGRRVMWELIVECGVFEEGWDEGNRIHYNAGRRAIGLRVLATLTGTFPEQYLDMEREARVRVGTVDAAVASAAQTNEAEDDA